MHSFSWNHDELVHEPAYNTHARRIFPWPGVPEPSWGGAWVAVDPGDTVTPHAHDEKEIFLVVAGEGLWRMGEEERKVGFGDTLYMTPFVEHALTNTGAERLVFVSIWWDSAEAVAKERAAWAEKLGVPQQAAEAPAAPAADSSAASAVPDAAASRTPGTAAASAGAGPAASAVPDAAASRAPGTAAASAGAGPGPSAAASVPGGDR